MGNSRQVEEVSQNFWEASSDADLFNYYPVERMMHDSFKSYDARGFITSGDLFRQGRVSTMVCRHHLKSVFRALELLNSDPRSVIDLFCAQCTEEALAESS